MRRAIRSCIFANSEGAHPTSGIARVNRLYEDETLGAEKEFGYIIDYASILGELDQALTMYAEAGLSDFDEEDLEGTLTSINAEVAKLPQIYSDLWDLFKEVKNQHDEEAYEVLQDDAVLRRSFTNAWLTTAMYLPWRYPQNSF